ncbi:MAG: hypothetical protein M1821_009174 [Bathelium mastoideum]|nr:MAG: hypothetical protein M1821_009174 [Bathelium mastoideum]
MHLGKISLHGALSFGALTALFLWRLGVCSLRQSVLFSLFSGLTLWIIYRSFIYPFYQSPLRHIPTVPSVPLWGHFFQIITSEVGVPQREWHRRHGSIVRYFFPLGIERLSITDDEAIKQVTVHDCYKYAKPTRVQDWMASILGRGVLLVDGREHMKQRKALTPAFSTSSIRTLAPIFWRKGLLMTNILRHRFFNSKTKNTPSVEMLDWMNRATLDVIGEAGFGHVINSLEYPTSSLRQAYASLFAFDLWSRLIQALLQQSQVFRFIPSKMNRRMLSAGNIIRSTANNIVNEKLDRDVKDEKHDILSLVVNANKLLREGDADHLSFVNMCDQVMTFLGAGHDTTATGVVWTLHLLSKHQHVQDRLRQEILSTIPSLDSYLTAPECLPQLDVDQLPYLNNVCRESLRYIPPIPITIREALCDTSLAEYDIPKGTIVYVMANAINRMEEYWGPRPDEFDPDRWDKLPPTYTANAFMTFLHGPRSCVGRKFAEMEMKVFLCCLLGVFKFEPDDAFDDQENWKMWRLVLRPRDGMHLKVSAVQAPSGVSTQCIREAGL